MSDILNHLVETRKLESQINALGLRQQLNELRHWQCARLLRSYQALYKNSQYQPAMDFFTEELYGPNDFSQRDKDIEKVLPIMESVLSSSTMETFSLALQLNHLSYQLDIQLLEHLDNTTHISNLEYAQAYQKCNNLSQRQLQLDYIELLANQLNRFARRASVILMLKLSRKPARLAGLSELQALLEKGTSAFKKIGNIDGFIQPVICGERKIMLALFDGKVELPLQPEKE